MQRQDNIHDSLTKKSPGGFRPNRTILMILVAVLLLITAPRAFGSKRAIVIGINIYNPNPAQQPVPNSPFTFNRVSAPGNWTSWKYKDLSGAVSDAELMKGTLESMGFQVVPLYDAQATANNILATLKQELVDNAQAGDVRVVYYSGHGAYAYNKASLEPDHFDQTIVPADHYRNVPDIRDKELSRILYAAGKKGVVVTMIADSCHSSSLSRGPWNNLGQAKTSDDPGPPVVVNDPADMDGGKPIDPKGVGVLFISATQSNDEALETTAATGKHGAFTWELYTVLSQGGINESMNLVFNRTANLLKAAWFSQVPTIEGNPKRMSKGIFGQDVSTINGLVVSVERVNDDTILLRGGIALGLFKGTQLVRIHADGKKDADPVKIEVKATDGVAYSEATQIDKSVQIIPGDLFQIIKWVAPANGGLRAYLPQSAPLGALQAFLPELQKLRSDVSVNVLSDYTEGQPTDVLYWTGLQWELVHNPAHGMPLALGATTTADAVKKSLDKNSKLLVILPPPAELIGPLRNLQDNRLTLLDSADGASYWLHGRLGKAGLEYAWIRADAGDAHSGGVTTSPKAASQEFMPVRTDWIFVSSGADVTSAAAQLVDKALGLGKLQGWLTIANPADTNRSKFPWHLVLMNAQTKKIVTAGDLHGGEEYKVCLQASTGDASRVGQDAAQRWVYVFGIDQDGQSALFFPIAGRGNDGNQFPHRSSPNKPLQVKPLYVLTGDERSWDFQIAKPYGVDTYILVTSDEPLDPDIFQFDGVISKGSGGDSALANLLLSVGKRSFQTPVPSDWSVERLSLRSVGQ